MNKQYVTALEESLEKKIRVLDEIYRISRLQTEILDKKPMDFENDKVCRAFGRRP